MLSKTSRAALALSVNLVYSACAAPVKWTKASKGVIFVQSKSHTILCYMSFTLMVIYESFLIFRLFQACIAVAEGQHVRVIIQISYFVCTYAIPVHLQLNTFYRWDQLSGLIKSYVEFFDLFKKLFLIPQKKPQKNGCETLFKIFYILAILINVQNAVLFLRNPDKSFFFSSLLTKPRELTFLQRLPFFLVHGCIWSIFWSQILFYGHLMYAYTFPGIFILGQMRLRKKSELSQELTKSSLRRADVFIKMYRALQVQHKSFNYCLRIVFLPGHKVLMSGLAILSIYGAMKVNNSRAILMFFAAFTSLLYMSVLFRKLGRFYETSEELLHSWKGQTKYLQKFIKSCCPLSVKVGSFYVVKLSTVLSLWGFVINTTITLLLM